MERKTNICDNSGDKCKPNKYFHSGGKFHIFKVIIKCKGEIQANQC